MPETVFSPTETAAWDRCPIYWKTAYVEAWSSRVADYPAVTRWLGQAFAKGMAGYLGQRGDDPVAIAVKDWNARRERWLTGGGSIDDKALERVGDIEAGLTRIITRTIGEDVLADSEWHVVAVEQPLVNGHTTPDAIYQHENGTRLIRDWKTSWNLESRWRAKAFSRYLNSDQLKQYCVFGNAQQVLITLTSATPLWCQSQTLTYTERELQTWLAYHGEKWIIMQQHKDGVRAPWTSNIHDTPYGPCLFQDWCFNHAHDPAVLTHLDFIKEPRDP